MLGSIESDYRVSVARERSLSAALEAQKREAQDLSRKAVEYSVLEREANTPAGLRYAQQRAREIGLSGELKTNNIRLVDVAEIPNVPVSPQRALGLLAALAAAMAGAVGLAFFFESIDDRIKVPDQITAELGLPFMGLLPLVPRTAGQNPLINNGVPANFSEAFRVIRMNVLFSSADEGGQTIVVTSAQPAEGKTLVASNLAIGIAQAGQRVLLVDADMRRRASMTSSKWTRARLVGPPRRDGGAGPGRPDDFDSRPDMLPSAIRQSRRTARVQRFTQFLGILECHFDWVIDTRP